MEETNEQLLLGKVETNVRFSQKLLLAFNEKHHSLESQFLCLSCNGISIDPLFCKECGYSYCRICLLVLPESNLRCLCGKNSKANFETKLGHELQKTKYWVEDQSSFSKKQITYLEASSYSNEIPFSFLPINNYDLTYKDNKMYNSDMEKIKKHLTIHKQEFDYQLALKKARLINFHFAKGYALSIRGKNICKYDATFLGIVHLREIVIDACIFNLDFSFNFCKSIRFNTKRIEIFSIVLYYDYYYPKIDFKTWFIILNPLQFCTKIKCLTFELDFYEYVSPILYPKSFYNFFSTFYVVKTIYFRNLIFDDEMNLNSFKSLISLQTLQLKRCWFQNKFLFYCLLDNIPNLNELILVYNKIKGNSFNTNINEENFKLKKNKKISQILIIESAYNCIENTIFKDLIQFDKTKMKYIEINFFMYNAPIPNFIDFLKSSNLQYLNIRFLSEIEGCNLEEFCNYLRNSQFLIGFKLFGISIDDTKFGLLLEAISVNKSIKVLYFGIWNLSNSLFDLINLILTNQNITTLILKECQIKIYMDFIEALSKNKTLLNLDLKKNEIDEESASKLSSLNLKGINVEDCSISEESEELIYQKIPRKEFPEDLLSYENF